MSSPMPHVRSGSTAGVAYPESRYQTYSSPQDISHGRGTQLVRSGSGLGNGRSSRGDGEAVSKDKFYNERFSGSPVSENSVYPPSLFVSFLYCPAQYMPMHSERMQWNTAMLTWIVFTGWETPHSFFVANRLGCS